MSLSTDEVDVVKNHRTIEWLKSELVSSIGGLFKAVIAGGDDMVVDFLARIITSTYLLGRRLGLSFARVDLKIEHNLKSNIANDHELEEWYGDLSALTAYLDSKKR
ncbi:MAG TPA: MazG-like family protein [Candidatus Deferrimicrobium sp.]|nr:MazG-like family protein [Candidatus Deferrimicrobium sp.]